MLRIDRSETSADFAAAHALIAEMGEWDHREMTALGLAGDDLIARFYSASLAMLEEKFARVGASFLIARWDGEPSGCVGFSGPGDGTAEVQKMFVRPGMRGRGIGRKLMASILDEMKQASVATAQIETVTFMREAIALYESVGFERCRPFRPPPPDLESISIYLERTF